MKTPSVMLIAGTVWLAAASFGAAAQEAAKLRADPYTPVETLSNADTFRVERDRPPIARDFVEQPPLVPHPTASYRITKNFNQCMDCHSWARYMQTQSTKVSLTHFRNRDGIELSNISSRRYFCTQCHVPQTETKPLVQNTFRRAEGMGR
jgi:cytochrome c-type protein NapB